MAFLQLAPAYTATFSVTASTPSPNHITSQLEAIFGTDMELELPFHPLHDAYARYGTKVWRGISISKWKQDDSCSHCGICTRKFNLIRRKHHCRVCGDICCRRCLVFCLVEVPLAGIDLAYTCAKCIRLLTRHSMVESFSTFVSADARNGHRPRSTSFPASTEAGEDLPSPSPSFQQALKRIETTATSRLPSQSAPNTPPRSSRAPSPSTTAKVKAELPLRVALSQEQNQKLRSVCLLLCDYLDCKSSAIVLIDKNYFWLLACQGVSSAVLSSKSFFAICSRTVELKRSFSLSKNNHRKRSESSAAGSSSSNTYQFFGAAPIFGVGNSTTKNTTSISSQRSLSNKTPPIGCVVILDTKQRDDGKKIQKTAETLAQNVHNILKEEKNLLRVYFSGDFKWFTRACEAKPAQTTTPVASASSSTAATAPPTRSPTPSQSNRFTRVHTPTTDGVKDSFSSSIGSVPTMEEQMRFRRSRSFNSSLDENFRDSRSMSTFSFDNRLLEEAILSSKKSKLFQTRQYVPSPNRTPHRPRVHEAA